MKSLFCVIILISLGGCAQRIWDKPGGTRADFNRDSYTCEKDARQSGYYGGGIAGALAMRNFYDRCMVVQGYTLRQ